MIEDRVCCICGRIKAYQYYRYFGDKENWDEKSWNICFNTKDPRSHQNLQKLMTKSRNKQLGKDTNRGKGFIGEQIFCKVRSVENCNLKLDNFNSKVDVVDKEYGRVQIKTSSLLLREKVWSVTKIGNFFDTLVIICMSNDFTNVERVYIIPKRYVGNRSAITIYKNPSRSAWYENFKMDDGPYNVAFHSMKLDNCPVLRKDKKIMR